MDLRKLRNHESIFSLILHSCSTTVNNVVSRDEEVSHKRCKQENHNKNNASAPKVTTGVENLHTESEADDRMNIAYCSSESFTSPFMFAERDEALLVSPFQHFSRSRRLNGGAWEPGPRLFIAGERLEETTSMRLGRNVEGRPVTKPARAEAGGWMITTLLTQSS